MKYGGCLLARPRCTLPLVKDVLKQSVEYIWHQEEKARLLSNLPAGALW